MVTNSLLNERVVVYQYEKKSYMRIPVLTPGGLVYGNVVPANSKLDDILRQEQDVIKRNGVKAHVLPTSSETLYYAAKSAQWRTSPKEFLSKLGYPDVPVEEASGGWRRVQPLTGFIPNKPMAFLATAFIAFSPEDTFSFSDGSKFTGVDMDKRLHEQAAADLEKWRAEVQADEAAASVSRGTGIAEADLKRDEKNEDLEKLASLISGGFKQDLFGHMRNHHLLDRVRVKEETNMMLFWDSFERDVNEVGQLATRLGARFGNTALAKLGRMTPHMLSFAKNICAAHGLFQIGNLASLAGTASVASALSASLALVDMFREDEGEEGYQVGIFQALESIMTQLRELAGMMDEIRYEMRISFAQLQDTLETMEHKNYIYFESLSQQLDCVLAEAQGMHFVNHANFAALKDQIHQLGQELGYDTAAIATLPLHSLYDRAQDLVDSSSQKINSLSYAEIETAHKEILGPLASWAGTAPHGMFNGLRYLNPAGLSRLEVDIEIFSKNDPYSVVAYLVDYALERGIKTGTRRGEDIGCPHLWLQATRAYIDLRSQVHLPFPKVEPRHILAMISRGDKLVRVVEKIHQSDDSIAHLFRARSESQLALLKLVSKKRTQLQLGFAREYLLSVSNQRLATLSEQIEAFQSRVGFNLFGDDSTRFLWEKTFRFTNQEVSNLHRIHDQRKHEFIRKYQETMRRIESLQGMLSSEHCPRKAMEIGRKLVKESHLVLVNVRRQTRVVSFVVPEIWISGSSPFLAFDDAEGFASQSFRDILNEPELFGLGYFQSTVDVEWTPSKLQGGPYFGNSRVFEFNGYDYTITKKKDFVVPLLKSTGSDFNLLTSVSHQRKYTVTPGQVDLRVRILGQAMTEELDRITSFGEIHDIEHLFTPSLQGNEFIADSIFAVQFPLSLLQLHTTGPENPSLIAGDDMKQKTFAMNLYQDWLRAVMKPYSDNGQQVAMDGLDVELGLAEQVYTRDVKAIESFAKLLGYQERDWSPLYSIIRDPFISDPWLNELFALEEVFLTTGFIDTAVRHPIFVDLQLRVKQLARLGLQLYSNDPELNEGIRLILSDIEFDALKAEVVPVINEKMPTPSITIDARLASLETDVKSLRSGQTELVDSMRELKYSFMEALQQILDVVSRN